MTFAIAHRGLHTEHPENSLAAIEAALVHGSVVELDVRCTHDAVPVLTHDASLERTHGIGAKVGHCDAEELRASAPQIATLAEALDLVADHDGAAMLDVKVSRPRAVDAIERVVAASRMGWNDGRQLRAGEQIDPGTLTFQSADAQLLQAFRSRTGAGCLELVLGNSSSRALVLTAPFITAYAQGVTIPEAISSRPVLLALHALRLGTYVYTVDDPARCAELERHGADGFYTDRIDLLAPV